MGAGRRTNVCPDCDRSGWGAVLGNCSRCFGTGVNVELNSEDPKCRNCGGSGKCPTCGGTGRLSRNWE